VDDTDRVALWLACFVLSLNVPFPEFFKRKSRQETWWEADGVIIDVLGHYPSYRELRDFRASWRFMQLHPVADERRLPRQAVACAWAFLRAGSWWAQLRAERMKRGLHGHDAEERAAAMGFNLVLVHWPNDAADYAVDECFDGLRCHGDKALFYWLLDCGDCREHPE
jgi:hypothetical protein